MSRAKKRRRDRSKKRRAKRVEKMAVRIRALSDEMRARSKARQAVDASDMPEGLKMWLGVLVDPAGAAQKLVRDKMREAGVTLPSEEEKE